MRAVGVEFESESVEFSWSERLWSGVRVRVVGVDLISEPLESEAVEFSWSQWHCSGVGVRVVGVEL